MLYEQIERDYKERRPDRDFNLYYFKYSSIIASVYFIVSLVFKFNFFISILIMTLGIIVILIIYIRKDLNNYLTIEEKNLSVIKKFFLYINHKNDDDEKKELKTIYFLLEKYNIKTKEEIKLIIDYYNVKIPVENKVSILGWIMSAAVSIASFIIIAYDNEKGIIDNTKLFALFNSVFGLILTIIIPILVFKFIISEVTFSKVKLYSELVDKFSYFYINFSLLEESIKDIENEKTSQKIDNKTT